MLIHKLLRVFLPFFVSFLLISCGGNEGSSAQNVALQIPAQKQLAIAPVYQQTPLWCWAATLEMIYRYYGIASVNPNFQCGILAMTFGPSSICYSNCGACVVGGGTVSNVANNLTLYSDRVSFYTGIFTRKITSKLLFSHLDETALKSEIALGRPILAGISPSGFPLPDISQHAVLLVGYRDTPSDLMVIVNDPYPYLSDPSQPNPYLFSGGKLLFTGQYEISYRNFVGGLRWGNTIYGIQ